MQVTLIKTLQCFGEPYFAEFTPDGKLLAVGDNSQAVTLRGISTWKLVRSIKVNALPRSIAFSKHSHVMAVGTAWNPTLQTWDTQSWKRRSIIGHPQEITSISLDDAGRLIASCGDSNDNLLVRDVSKNRTVFSYPAKDEMITSVALSPDGKVLAAAVGQQVIVWETHSWKIIHKIRYGKEYFQAVCFSSDGGVLACSCGHDNSLLLLTERSSWKTRFFLRGHQGFIDFLSFAPGSKMIASACTSRSDGTIRLWNIVTGALIYTIPQVGKSHTGLCFHPTENLLASACNDETVSIFRLTNT